MGNKPGAQKTERRPNEGIFLQLLSYSSPPRYYDGQDPLPIDYELVLYPSEHDSTRLIVEKYSCISDEDGPKYDIRAGTVDASVFQKICGLLAAKPEWTGWSAATFRASARDPGLILLKPRDANKNLGVFLNHQLAIQVPHSTTSGRSPNQPASVEQQAFTAAYSEFVQEVKNMLEPFASEQVPETRFPTCSFRHRSAFVDMESVLNKTKEVTSK